MAERLVAAGRLAAESDVTEGQVGVLAAVSGNLIGLAKSLQRFVPHESHDHSRAVPQPPQNFARGAFSWLHTPQFMPASRHRPRIPHSVQPRL